MVKILCVGPLWRGSNAGALFKALSRNGCLIEIIDENYFIPLNTANFLSKATSKLSRDYFIADFNSQILKIADQFKPNLCLVYKGAFVLPKTLNTLKHKKISIVNFYPDVSFHTHGKLIKKTLSLFDHIFTTKTFGIADMKNQLGILNSSFIPHGFDPEIHRPILTPSIADYFKSDVSFIGTWSSKKEYLLSEIIKALPDINLKIWGDAWDNIKSSELKPFIQHTKITGDLYALALSNCKINLGILSEQVKGASSGDKITSRTFHIPGAGGFLLHERNEESIQYFKENEEAAFFETTQELIDKIRYFLLNEEERIKMAQAGKKRAWEDHTLDKRAQLLLQTLEIKNLI